MVTNVCCYRTERENEILGFICVVVSGPKVTVMGPISLSARVKTSFAKKTTNCDLRNVPSHSINRSWKTQNLAIFL